MTSTMAQIHVLSATLFSSRFSTKPTNMASSRTVFLGQGLTKTTPLCLTAIAIATPKGLPVSPHAKRNPTGGQKWTHQGSVVESLPNGLFRILLDNEGEIIGYISGKIRKNSVRILPGDKVEVEVNRYDTSRGRIVYRFRNRDPSAD